jgi:hypothetical protein
VVKKTPFHSEQFLGLRVELEIANQAAETLRNKLKEV